jgi:hypothetical protein
MTKWIFVLIVAAGTTFGCCNEHVRPTLLLEASIGLLAGALMVIVSLVDKNQNSEPKAQGLLIKEIRKEMMHAFVGGFLAGLLLGLMEVLLRH